MFKKVLCLLIAFMEINGKDITVTLNEELKLVAFTVSSEGVLGDGNSDGEVNIKDATLIQKHLAKLLAISGVGLAVADVNSDGDANVKDATVIQKYVAGITVAFPVGEKVTV